MPATHPRYGRHCASPYHSAVSLAGRVATHRPRKTFAANVFELKMLRCAT
jgi:hypothetical protein